MELDEVPDESDLMPFSEEVVVKTIYDGRPQPGRRHASNLSPGTPTHYYRGYKDTGM
jgi:hypothetical protein